MVLSAESVGSWEVVWFVLHTGFFDVLQFGGPV